MMPTLAVCITALLLCNYLCSSATVSQSGLPVDSSATTNSCTDANSCVHPDYCIQCNNGSGPSCASAQCVDGKCQIIAPCSQKSQLTTATPPADICTDNSECPHSELCAFKCNSGTTPRCASAKCVNGKCIPIAPCSQHICKTKATCPYNKKKCAPCPFDYGPGCEQAVCSCGICSIISPCSKKLATAVNPVPIESK